jgi:hypothetical protein
MYGLQKRSLEVNEMFIAKYQFAPDRQRSLAPHQDGSQFSFVLTLNEPDVDFTGGGTRFIAEDALYRPGRGNGIIFSGKQLHEGVALTGGTRYILTGFCSYDPEDGSHESYLLSYDPRWDGRLVSSSHEGL